MHYSENEFLLNSDKLYRLWWEAVKYFTIIQRKWTWKQLRWGWDHVLFYFTLQQRQCHSHVYLPLSDIKSLSSIWFSFTEHLIFYMQALRFVYSRIIDIKLICPAWFNKLPRAISNKALQLSQYQHPRCLLKWIYWHLSLLFSYRDTHAPPNNKK